MPRKANSEPKTTISVYKKDKAIIVKLAGQLQTQLGRECSHADAVRHLTALPRLLGMMETGADNV